MSTATPIPPPVASDDPQLAATPAEPPRRSQGRLWLILGGLTVLFLAAVGITIVFLSGADDTAVVNEHTAEATEPSFIEVPGYVYTDPQAGDVADWDATMTQTNEKMADLLGSDFADTPWVTSWSLHDVDRATEGRDFLWLGLIEINPQFANVPSWDTEFFITSVAGDMTTGATTLWMDTINDEPVAVGWEATEGWTMFAWLHEGTVSVAAGPDESAVRSFVEAYIIEQNS